MKDTNDEHVPVSNRESARTGNLSLHSRPVSCLVAVAMDEAVRLGECGELR